MNSSVKIEVRRWILRASFSALALMGPSGSAQPQTRSSRAPARESQGGGKGEGRLPTPTFRTEVQLVPQPGPARFDNTRGATEYGYKQGVIQGAAAIVRVTVSPTTTLVEYVRAYPASAKGGDRQSGKVSHAYHVLPR